MYIVPMHLANAILEISLKRNIPISPIKLQRLMYLAFCGYLQETGKPLFSEEFQTWSYGPVILSAYWKFQCFHQKPITCYGKDVRGGVEMLDMRTNRTLRRILGQIEYVFMRMSVRELCEITRAPGTAWYKAFQAGNETLNIEDIKNDPCFSA